MTTLRTYALREAERLAMNEALNAMANLAEVRERALAESEDGRRELHEEVLAAEKLHEQAVDRGDELLAGQRELVSEHNAATIKQDARERRILSVLDKAMAMLPPGAFAEIQGHRNAALAEEIPF